MSKFQQITFIFLLVSGVITLVAGDAPDPKFHECVKSKMGDPKDAFPAGTTIFTPGESDKPDKSKDVDITIAQTLKGIEACASDAFYPKTAGALKNLKPLLPQVYTVGATKIDVASDTADDALAALLVIGNIGEVCNPKDSPLVNGKIVAEAGKNMLFEIKKGETFTYSAFCGGSATQLGGGLKGNETNLTIKNIVIKAGADAAKGGDGASGGVIFEASSVSFDTNATLYLDNDKEFKFTVSNGKKIAFKGENKIMSSSGFVLNHDGDVTFENVAFYNVKCTGKFACIDASAISKTEVMNVVSMSDTAVAIMAKEITDSKIWNVNNSDTKSAAAIKLSSADKAIIKSAYISTVYGGKGFTTGTTTNAGGDGIESQTAGIIGSDKKIVNMYCIAGTDATQAGVGSSGYSFDKDTTSDQAQLPDKANWPDCTSPPKPPVIPKPSSSFSSFSAQLLAGGFALYVLSAVAKFM